MSTTEKIVYMDELMGDIVESKMRLILYLSENNKWQKAAELINSSLEWEKEGFRRYLVEWEYDLDFIINTAINNPNFDIHEMRKIREEKVQEFMKKNSLRRAIKGVDY
jgi:hypothetical protein